MVGIKVDTSAFDRAFKEYLNYNKRSLAEIVNTKAYFIARNAIGDTKAADKGKIEKELMGPSKDYPKAPLAAIIINSQRGKGNGLSGAKMKAAVEKLIRARKAHVNFVRSGWKTAMKQLASAVPSKRGQRPVPAGVRDRRFTGGAKAAKANWFAIASIWNSARDKTGKGTAKIQQILQDGAQKAIDRETASMKEYVMKKLQEHVKRFNKA
jgi:hypothetical protein